MGVNRDSLQLWVGKVSQLTKYLSQDFLGGPRPIRLATVINIQKGGTFFFVLFLMYLYQNFSIGMYVYLALHGTYGFCWLMKDVAFPDKSWDRPITIGGALMTFGTVLAPYWSFAWILATGIARNGNTAPYSVLCLAITLHTFGLAMMIAADAQKFYTLKFRRGLIECGMFRWIRHPNYLGEMMIYGSYALVVGHWIPWCILLFVWVSVFLVNMLMKEASMARYPEWSAYKARTGVLLPPLQSFGHIFSRNREKIENT